MRIRPTAMGIEVVPICISMMKRVTPGRKYPTPMPKAMAIKIHNVR